MTGLLKELCKLSGLLSDLVIKEKEAINRKVLLSLICMVSDKIITAATNYEEPNPGDEQDAILNGVLEKIKSTGGLVTGYKNNSKTVSDLFDHVLRIANELEVLFFKDNNHGENPGYGKGK